VDDTVEDATLRTLLGRYVSAWALADVPALVALLHEDATLAMPPIPEWVEGAAAIGASLGAMVFTPDSRGRFRLVPMRASGRPAFAAYKDGEPMAIHVLDVKDGRIATITAFLDASLFARFGLPARI
jgi:RNA polymerase sigma-70 factor (ECF subfamily)